jgi:hypothetical protein
VLLDAYIVEEVRFLGPQRSDAPVGVLLDVVTHDDSNLMAGGRFS